MGDGRIFLKTRRDVSFKKGLSNEPTFGLIHLVGQYLYGNPVGAVAESYMTNGSSYMTKYLRISSYIRKPFLIYGFATAPIWISLYMRKIHFLFYKCVVS